MEPSLTTLELNIFQKKVKKINHNNNIKTNIYGIQANESVICGYFCIGFIDFVLKGRSLLDYTNSLLPNECGKIDKILLKCF